MIVRKLVFGVIALGLLSASASTAVFAAAFAVYALLRGVLTPPGAAGAVILLVAVIAAVAALILMNVAKILPVKPARRPPAGGDGAADLLVGLVKQRPFVAGGVGLAAGLLALANPKIITAVLKAFTDTSRGDGRRRRD